jgi:NADH-quinone oxidoreductase subunit E
MSVRRLAEIQPASFAFTPENAAWCDKQIAKYPEHRQASAILSLLWRAQKQHDYWLPKPAIEEVARMLGMPYIRVLEVATFYTMFNLEPVGKYFIQMCGTTPCVLAGSDDIKAVLEKRVGPQRHVTADGLFSWLEVECLGACCNAPMVQINDDYYEDLSAENFNTLLDDLAAGRPVTIGSQTGRKTSEPAGGLTSLMSLYGVDGKSGPQCGTHESNRRGARPEPEHAHGQDDMTANQVPTPAEPAMARQQQEDEHSVARPDKTADTGTTRTQTPVSDSQNEHKAAQAAAKGGPADAPATPPGHEPPEKKA